MVYEWIKYYVLYIVHIHIITKCICVHRITSYIHTVTKAVCTYVQIKTVDML